MGWGRYVNTIQLTSKLYSSTRVCQLLFSFLSRFGYFGLFFNKAHCASGYITLVSELLFSIAHSATCLPDPLPQMSELAMFYGQRCFMGCTVLWVALFYGLRCFMGCAVLWAALFYGLRCFMGGAF